MDGTSFEYSNLSGRPSGPVLRWAGRLLPGVREVQRQVEPYAAAWEAANRRALAADGPLWVALGDSMTQGIGASAYDRGWVGQLAGRLPRRLPGRFGGLRVLNLSFYGARVGDVLERQLPALESLGVEPELVTVLIGNNDLVSRTWRPLVDDTMATLLGRLPAGTVVANQPGDSRPSVRSFNAVIDTGVRTHDLVLAEFRDPRMSSWRGRLSRDWFHPNDLGYTGIADLVDEAVR